MRMFDYVDIDIKLLPITKKEKKDLRNELFQTKSMDNALNTICIKRDGIVVRRNITWDNGDIVPDSRYKKLQDYSGCILFYGGGASLGWYEFLAKIRHGKLKEIIRVYERF